MDTTSSAGKEPSKTPPYEYPKIIMASYGCRELFSQWVIAAFGFTVFFYYESVVGLDVKLAALAYIIYQVWNSVNDPLAGYLMERVHFPWERKRGYRRMPFIVVGGLLWLVSYLMIYLGPTDTTHQWSIFAWYVVSLCLFDVFGTLFDVNVVSLYQEKFRGLKDRRMVQGFGTILGITGLVLAATVPPLFITTGVTATYRNSAMVTVGVGLFLFLLMIPGIIETPRVKEMYRRRREEIDRGAKLDGFFATMKTALTNRRFVAKVILFFGYQVGAIMLQTSALYIVTYLLDEPASAVSLLLGSMLVGALISVPLWTAVSQRVNNNRRLSIIGGFLLTAAFIPMIFVQSLTAWIVSLLFFGMAVGNQWFMDPPTMGDVLDDVAVRTGRRDPAVYLGYQSLIFKLGQSSIAAVIAVVHTWTGFVSGAPSLRELTAQSESLRMALFGIRIHSAIVPAVVMLIATLLFWKLYDLTPDKVMANKEKLDAMGI